MIKIVFDGFALIIFGILIFSWFFYHIVINWKSFWYNMIKAKAWAKVYTNYPDMLLDRKYGVKYKKHWWNKYKIYKEPNRKYNTDYLYREALEIVNKIEAGEIKI